MKLTNVTIDVDALLAEIPDTRLVEELKKRNCHFVEPKKPQITDADILEDFRDEKEMHKLIDEAIAILKQKMITKDDLVINCIFIEYVLNKKNDLSIEGIYDQNISVKASSRKVTPDQKEAWKEFKAKVMKKGQSLGLSVPSLLLEEIFECAYQECR